MRWNIQQIDEAIHDYEVQFASVLASDSSIILSGEGLSLLSTTALSQLVERIQAMNFAIHPIALVRSPLDYAHSIAQQLIRGGQHLELVGCGSLLSPQSMKRLTIPDGQREILNLLSVFGDQLTLVPFRRACAHPQGPVGFLLSEFCGFSKLDLIKFQSSQESKSNGWVRVQNLINKRWPIFDQKKQLNPDHFRLRHELDYTGKFRLTSKEIELLSSQIEKSNHSMINLLSDEFVIADNFVSEELSASDLAKVVADLCKISLPSHDVF